MMKLHTVSSDVSMRIIFHTPKEAEKAFYQSLERSDLETMKQVWGNDDSIVCIHPGSGRLQGRAEILESFSQMFRDAPIMDFSITDTKRNTVADLSIHTVREEIEIDGQLVSIMLSTNIYQQIDGSWRLMLHHTSPEPDPDFDYDDLDFTLDNEATVVLH